MQHFESEEWADFARGLVSAEKRQAMQEHLADGCTRCTRELDWMKQVGEAAGREASYEPPADVVRVVKSLSGASRLVSAEGPSRQFAGLIFDSFGQPVALGVRAALATSRQLLYRKGDCNIDITLERASGANEVILVGQILNSGRPDRGVGAVLVELLSGDKVIANAATTSHGEFQFLFPPTSNLQLCIAISSENCFWVKIPPLETIPESGLVVSD